jgi:hypothetical protein
LYNNIKQLKGEAMLYNIATSNDDEVFAKCLMEIRKSLYDEEGYKISEIENRKLPTWGTHEIPPEEAQIKSINNALKELRKIVCVKKYKIINKGQKLPFPFIEKYHAFFHQRRWNRPIRDPAVEENAAELFRLHELENNSRRFQNYSKNSGNYNHFLNVIAAISRLINYLQTKENVLQLIGPASKDMEGYAENVKFDHKDKGLRIFILMLAAFFHDIGKTVVNHRHGMEGSIIISEQTSQSWYQINRIAEAHEIKEPFERNDLMFISDLINIHDQFGTLSTGEAGYLQLIDIIEKLKRYSLKYPDKKEQRIWSERYLFDLWLLNLADIMVSIKDKWKWQEEWEKADTSVKEIQSFITIYNNKRLLLVHDLHFAVRLLEEINKHRHTDIFSNLSIITQDYSDRHTVERIRRLIYSCIELSIIKDASQLNNLENILPYLTREQSLSEFEITGAIVRSIDATRNLRDFCNRFSWIGQMDYSLGFFESICSRALRRVNEELDTTYEGKSEWSSENKQKYCFRTKWIRDKFSSDFGGDKDDKDYLNILQSKLFVENFVTTVINILDHLLFRQDDINRIKNIEFNETRERLTPEKIDAIISLDGPFHAKRSVQMILKTVFIY